MEDFFTTVEPRETFDIALEYSLHVACKTWLKRWDRFLMKTLKRGAGALGLAPSCLTGTGLFQASVRTGSSLSPGT